VVGEFDGVTKQVGERPLEHHRIAQNDHRFAIDTQFEALGGQRCEQIDDIASENKQIDTVPLERSLCVKVNRLLESSRR
jgi:hypothetical protein